MSTTTRHPAGTANKTLFELVETTTYTSYGFWSADDLAGAERQAKRLQGLSSDRLFEVRANEYDADGEYERSTVVFIAY